MISLAFRRGTSAVGEERAAMPSDEELASMVGARVLLTVYLDAIRSAYRAGWVAAASETH